MAEENDDKTEAPTPHRLEKAREEGQIPRSRELTSLLILIVGVCIIWWGGESLARKLAGMLSTGLRFDHSMVNDPNLILSQIIQLIKGAMVALLPLITGVVLVALVSPVMLGGLVFSGKSLQPKFSKLNPLDRAALCANPTTPLKPAKTETTNEHAKNAERFAEDARKNGQGPGRSPVPVL